MIFITRKKLKDFINDAVDEKIHLNKWHDFLRAPKVGYIIKYEGLEWECVKQSYGFNFNCGDFEKLDLMLAGQKKTVKFYADEPININFVYEEE